MVHGGNLSEESNAIETMQRNAMNTKTEELYMRQPSHKHAEHQPRRSSVHTEHCYNCGEARIDTESREPERRKRRMRSKLQHCPSCHCPPETIKYSPVRVNCSENIEAFLERCDHLLKEPVNSTIKKSQSNPLSPRLSSCGRCSTTYHPKKEKSRTRRRRKNEQDEMLSVMVRNLMNSGLNDSIDGCYSCQQQAVNNYCKSDGPWKEQALIGSLENSDVDSELPENFTRDYRKSRKPQTSKLDFRVVKHCVEKENKLSAEGKTETEENGENDLWQRVKYGDTSPGKLRFDVPEDEDFKEIDRCVENTNEEKEGIKKNLNALASNFPTMRPCELKTSALQGTSMKIKNPEDMQKNRIIDECNRTKDEGKRKELKTLPYRKPRRRSVVRKSVTCKTGDESTTNREETKENTHSELIVKDKNHETATFRKNICGGGDLDLHATKSHILGLIDRALSDEFGSASDQQKNIDSEQGLTQQEMCIEITRALQGDCCHSLAQNLLNRRGSSTDYIKQLKILRWEHLNHIQDEFRKLCNLLKFLDTYSPRQSLPTLHSNSNVVEQCANERHRQEEKQELETVP